MNTRSLVLADDLTGALEAGALYASSGVSSAVYMADLLPRDEWPEVLVLDIETRHSDPDRAKPVVARAVSDARTSQVSRIYIKLDSTLRGPVSAQITGAFEGWPGRSVVFAPAYPRMGRTVRDGVLFVNGRALGETVFANDPIEPAHTSRVADKAWQPGCGIPVEIAGAHQLRENLPSLTPKLFLCDAVIQEDLARLASVVLDNRSSCICAGSAGFLAEIILAEGVLHARTGLIVNGSLHAASIEQCAAARRDMQVVELESESRDDAVAAQLRSAVQADGWAVFSTGANRIDPQRMGKRTAEIVAAVLDNSSVSNLAIFGGDTAAHVLTRLGVKTITPVRELLPGIPISHIAVGGRYLNLITKAGGFGDAHVIREVRSALSGRNRI